MATLNFSSVLKNIVVIGYAFKINAASMTKLHNLKPRLFNMISSDDLKLFMG